MITIFTLTSHSSTRKALAWANNNQLSFKEQRMNTNPPTLHQLREMLRLSTDGTDDIISKKSKAYKMLLDEGIDFDELTLFELAYIVRKHPSIMRTPIILYPEKIKVGFHETEMSIPRVKRMAMYSKVLNAIRKEEDKRLDEGQVISRGIPGGYPV